MAGHCRHRVEGPTNNLARHRRSTKDESTQGLNPAASNRAESSQATSQDQPFNDLGFRRSISQASRPSNPREQDNQDCDSRAAGSSGTDGTRCAVDSLPGFTRQGVQDRIIQALMRHSSLSVTMKHYVKATPEANVEAMQKLVPKASKG